MADKSKIEWLRGGATWNPVTGCTPISAGCANCYARRFAERFRGTPGHPFEHGFDLQVRADRLADPAPFHWKKPRLIFVCSMSDLWHEHVAPEARRRVFEIVTDERARHHRILFLTKRANAMAQDMHLVIRGRTLTEWPNLWWGISAENDAAINDRIHCVSSFAASNRWVSLEPLIGPVETYWIPAVDWVIAGGETGPGCRDMHPDWVRSIRNECRAADVPFFLKSFGGVRKSKCLPLLDGIEHAAIPASLLLSK